ncbi:MAG: ABC transporter permease [Actinobacteria bacterium]|nr:ABC transporter permease [Actinomycetota bacterium]
MKQSSPEGVIYTPESQLRSPGRLIGTMGRDLIASRELAWRLVVRDLRARYRQTAFGFLWAFLPVLTALVFQLLNQSQVFEVRDTRIPYPLFVMFGTILWQTFVDSLNAPIRALTKNKSMLAKVNFPREALILGAVGEVLFDLGIRAVLLVGFTVWYGVEPQLGMVLAPFAALLLVLLGMMIGLFLAPFALLYEDVTLALPPIMTVWMFLTPVVFPVPASGLLSRVMHLNPATSILAGVRDLATTGGMPGLSSFLVVSGTTFVALMGVWVIYRLSIPILIERITA